MVTIQIVQESNAALKATASPGFVAVFAGATSGIGLSTLKELVRSLIAPKIYVVGRSKAKFALQLAGLTSLNPGASIEFVEAELSLLKDVDTMCDLVNLKERKLDLLYMSPGSLAFGGPNYTCEGLDTCLSISYYGRMRLTCNLLRLLRNSRSPRVLSVLAGGQERRLLTHDLGLKENYSILNVIDQTTTMQTLAFEYLAKDNPSVSFLHSYPGWVKTDIVKNLFSVEQRQPQQQPRYRNYICKLVGNWLFLPVFNLIATSVKECAERQLFHATNARYASRTQQQQRRRQYSSGDDDAATITTASSDSFATCSVPGNGVYRVAANGETLSDDKVLGTYRKMNMAEKIWEHTIGVFEEALTKRQMCEGGKGVEAGEQKKREVDSNVKVDQLTDI